MANEYNDVLTSRIPTLLVARSFDTRNFILFFFSTEKAFLVVIVGLREREREVDDDDEVEADKKRIN